MTRLGTLLSKFEMLRSLDAKLLLGLTLFTFQSKDDLTCGFSFLMEDGLSLSPETHLLGIVTTLSLGKVGSLSCLVLCNFVDSVLLALSSTVSSTFLWYVHHFDCERILS